VLHPAYRESRGRWLLVVRLPRTCAVAPAATGGLGNGPNIGAAMAPSDPAGLLARLVRAGQLATFEALPTLVAHHARLEGLCRAALYVADLQQDVLREVTGQGVDAGQGGEELRIDSTLAGRAFRDGQTLTAPLDAGLRHWVSIVSGIERLGLLRVDTGPATGTADTATL
jgi:hypothetical protein